MPTSLRSTLNTLATQFADGVLRAIRTASLDDLLAESKGRRADGGGGGRPSGGRLARRTHEQIAKTLDRVVSAVKRTKGKGMRAEEIREALELDVREMPRVLKEGLAMKKLKARGRKRATKYFAVRPGKP